MEMQVYAELCTGCGVSVEICPNGAIQLSEGLPVLDQAACTQCQSFVDACPVGAIAAIELPVAITKPVSVQSVSVAEIVTTEPASSNPKPRLSAALTFASRAIIEVWRSIVESLSIQNIP
jgi:Fe-S-cluster-containing hydrogenase component 2